MLREYKAIVWHDRDTWTMLMDEMAVLEFTSFLYF